MYQGWSQKPKCIDFLEVTEATQKVSVFPDLFMVHA